jgi:hypothetical protein
MRRDLPTEPVVAGLAAGLTLPGFRTVVAGRLGQHVAEDPSASAPTFGLGIWSAALVTV